MNVKPKLRVKLRAKAHCPTHSLANVEVRDVGFEIDEPEERGGTNKGPAPTETALAALLGCTNTIGHKCFKTFYFRPKSNQIYIKNHKSAWSKYKTVVLKGTIA